MNTDAFFEMAENFSCEPSIQDNDSLYDLLLYAGFDLKNTFIKPDLI